MLAGKGTALSTILHCLFGVDKIILESSNVFSVLVVVWPSIVSFTMSNNGGGTIVSRNGTIGFETFISTFAYLKRNCQNFGQG